jgi:nitroimidazol reductase NimA-like FMN-containing flavoprotein (pyridoxamine 5'-phosphate oxidase superfamily)
MRRSEKEIIEKDKIEWILNEAKVCRIAFCNDNKPYIVPMNFGFNDKYLFLHSATEGRKIDILNKNNSICFEMDIEKVLIKSETACNWGMKYYSVIGFGKASFIEDIQEKRKALDIIMKKYSGNTKLFEYSENTLKQTAIIKVQISKITGKKSGY